ncbi:hypothetical protein H9P43_001655 [Blastocladiella emersonii ATCC 22665]|nr:hypothetical protein H9P43_001655 [Blastocladiella emersonii ATCC 22665]
MDLDELLRRAHFDDLVARALVDSSDDSDNELDEARSEHAEAGLSPRGVQVFPQISAADYYALFGGDSDDSDYEFDPSNSVHGLRFFPRFLTPDEQAKVLAGLGTQYPHLLADDPPNEPAADAATLTESSSAEATTDSAAPTVTAKPNQAMYFAPTRAAGLPAWISDVGARVQSRFEAPANRGADFRFDQMILNTYPPGAGLTPHVDLNRFADGVAVLSFRSTLVMDLLRGGSDAAAAGGYDGPRFPAVSLADVAIGSPTVTELSDPTSLVDSAAPSIHWVTPMWTRVLLTPGSLLLLEADARWEWRHGIRETAVEYWPLDDAGTQWCSFRRAPRTSVTLRMLIPDE